MGMMMILDKLAFLHSHSKNIWSNNLIRMASFILSLSFIGVTLPLSGLKLWACAGMCKGKGSLSHDVQKIQSRMQWGTQLQRYTSSNYAQPFYYFIETYFFFSLSTYWLQFPLPLLLPNPAHLHSHMDAFPFSFSLENEQGPKKS